MTIIGSASIQIRADDKYFEPDVRRAVAKLKNVAIQLKADVDISAASKKIRDLRYRITSKDAVLGVDADVSKAEAKLQKLLDKFVNKEVAVKTTVDTNDAQQAIDDLHGKNTNNPIDIPANVNAGRLFDQLGRISRGKAKDIEIGVKLRPDTVEALQGALNVISGTLPVEKVRASILNVVTNFESLTVGAAKAGTAITSLAALAISASASLISVADDITQITGLLAFLPIGILALTAGLKANKFAWEGFGTAATDNSEKANKALILLPQNAQAAAIELRGLRAALQDSVQNAFWETMGTSLQDMAAVVFPQVREGMSAIGESMGVLQAKAFDMAATFAEAGSALGDGTLSVIEATLGNLAKGLLNASDAGANLVASFAAFAEVGSTYMPSLGTYINDLTERFEKFSTRARNNGDMFQWMDTGIRRAQELGSIIASTTTIFNGLSEAAKLSGAPGLTELADGFRNVADIVEGEPFKSNLVRVFTDARAGAERLYEGFGTLATKVAESTTEIGSFLRLGGEIAGLTFENITALFDGTGLGSGLYDALMGARDAMETLKPGFQDLGTLVGDLGEIAGVLFAEMAPGLNMLADTLSQVVGQLKDGIMGAMPVLNNFVQAVLALVQGPIVQFAGIVGNILEAFAGLPGPVQTAIASLGLFLLLKPRFDTFFTGIQNGAKNAFARVVTDGGTGITSITNLGRSMDIVRDSWTRVNNEFTTARGLGNAVGPLDKIKAVSGEAAKAIGTTAGQGLRMAGGGLMSMLGGPWGAALAVGAVAVGMYAQAQADAKARVDELSASLDKQTGAATGATKKIVIGDLLDFKSGEGKIESFLRFGSMTAKETMESIGLDIQDVAEKLMDPAASEAYINSWREIEVNASNFIPISDELAESVGLTADELNNLKPAEINMLAQAAQQAGNEFEKAQRKVRELAEATGTNTIEAARLQANYETLESTTSSVSAKFSALKDNIDILNDGTMSASDAQAKFAQSGFDTSAALTELASRQGVMVNSLVSTRGEWDMSSQAGVDFYNTLDAASDGILENATAVYDAALKQGDTVEEASRKAVQSTQEPIQALTASLAGLGLSQTQIEGVTAALGLVPTDIQAALSVQGAEDAQQKIFYTTVAAQAFASGNYSALLAALPDEAKLQIETATGMAGAFADGNYDAILRALDDTELGRTGALASLGAVADGDFTAEIDAIDFTPPTVNQAQASIDSIRAKTVELKATDATGPVVGAAQVIVDSLKGKNVDVAAVNKAQAEVDAAQAAVEGLKGKNVDVRAINLAQAAVDSAQGAVNSFKGKDVKATVTNLAQGPMNAAQGTVNTFRGKNVDATVKNLAGGPMGEAQRMVNSFNGKRVNVDVSNLAGGPVGEAQRAVNSFNGKTVALNVTSNAGPIAAAAQQSINNVQGKTVVITTRNETVYGGSKAANADGGLYTGNGVRLFANGGIMGRAAKAYAGGGVENHTAQIARGAWPARIWAEPETGGEAYLPLGKSKRKRSLEILKVVMDEFGIQGIMNGKAFANGGINMPNANPAVVSNRYATSNTSIANYAAPVGRSNGLNQPVIVVNPSQGLSERQIGEAAAKEFYWQSLNSTLPST